MKWKFYEKNTISLQIGRADSNNYTICKIEQKSLRVNEYLPAGTVKLAELIKMSEFPLFGSKLLKTSEFSQK